MYTVLKQRNYFVTKKFEITDKSLKVKNANLLGSLEEEFNFEDISCTIIRKNKLPWKTAIPAAFFLLGIIITVTDRLLGDKNNSEDILVYVVLFAIFGILTALNKQNTTSLIVYKIKALDFYTNSPSAPQVLAFLDLLKSTQKAYFMERYIHDLYLPPENLSNNIDWLYNTNFIDQNEFKALRANLLNQISTNNAEIKINFSNN